MNKVILVGRLVRDNDMRYSTGENATAILRNSVAINRKFKNSEGNYDADFPSILAFGKTAEFINQWFHKGDMIGIEGRITTGSYVNKEGNKVYTTEVTVENVEFVGSKNSSDNSATKSTKEDESWMNIPEDVSDENLPF